ncbi:MAG: hypothetical protein QNJ37_04720 [Crocosphaera sp.]|nr:hypothetical protein [Crocosphaera sp.]
MTFIINYITTTGTLVTEDLIPNATLAQRVRVIESKKELITLLDKIEAGLLLLADFIWKTEKQDPTFLNFQPTEETTDAEYQLDVRRNQLFNILQRIIANPTERTRIAKIVWTMALSKKEFGAFTISIDTEAPHNYEMIDDAAIADLIQQVAVNDLENVIKLI